MMQLVDTIAPPVDEAGATGEPGAPTNLFDHFDGVTTTEPADSATVAPPVDEAAEAEAGRERAAARTRASVIRSQTNFFDQFDSDQDAGEVSLEERMRLSAKDGFYRGTIAGAAELRSLVQAGRDNNWPADIKQQYENIVADLTRHDMLRPPSTPAEAAAVLAGQAMVGAPHAAAETGHSPLTPEEQPTPYVAELFARNAPTLGTPQEPQWPRPAVPDSTFERGAMTNRQRNRYSTPARDTLPIAEMMKNVLTHLATLPRRSFESAGRYNATGEYDPAPIFEAAGLMSGLSLGRGGLAGARMLPTDTASRTARAKEGGFHLDVPVAHASADAFPAFDLKKLGAATGTPTAKQGIWLVVRRPGEFEEVAQYYSELAHRANPAGRPQTYPLLYRANKEAAIKLTGKEEFDEVAAIVARAWDDGFDAVRISNFARAGGNKRDILVVRYPKQLRSPNAQFDPKKRDSDDLLAGVAGAAVVPPMLGTLAGEPRPDKSSSAKP